MKAVANIFPVMGKRYKRSDYALVDLTRNNPALRELPLDDLDQLEEYLEDYRKKWGAKLLWGGYGEKRYFYQASAHFGSRNIHLGVDIWASEGTPVFAPLDGKLHSQAFNDNYRDYGGTILVEHDIYGQKWVSLYGHLSKACLEWREPGATIKAGEQIAELGNPSENGGWIPHLHLQWIKGPIESFGDYPGVCNADEWQNYMELCPAPNMLIFQ